MYAIGLEFGLPNQFTSLAVVSVKGKDITLPDGRTRLQREYELVHLNRFTPGLGYSTIYNKVRDVTISPEIVGQSVLYLDYTGVGKPVIDDMYSRGMNCIPVTITSSGRTEQDEKFYEWKISKIDLIGKILTTMQSKLLTLAADLKEANALTEALIGYQLKPPTRTTETDIWREAPGDDLVFALGLALFGGGMVNIQTRIIKRTHSPIWDLYK